MMVKRRSFLKSVAIAPLAMALGSLPSFARAPKKAAPPVTDITLKAWDDQFFKEYLAAPKIGFWDVGTSIGDLTLDDE